MSFSYVKENNGVTSIYARVHPYWQQWNAIEILKIKSVAIDFTQIDIDSFYVFWTVIPNAASFGITLRLENSITQSWKQVYQNSIFFPVEFVESNRLLLNIVPDENFDRFFIVILNTNCWDCEF